jgi:uncharacterized protein (TIGR02569 family)
MKLTKKVLSLYKVYSKPERMMGGEGNSFKVGNFVFKPVDDKQEATWRAELMNSIEEKGFRVPHPIKSINNNWIEKNWCVYKFVKGKESKSRWKEKIEISRIFHRTLSTFSKPDFIDATNNPWAVADRMVWGKTKLVYGKKLKLYLDPLIKKLKPVLLENQLIHGDMTGNILFDDNLPPAIIDMSPYWHPSEYATAIIIVDSIVWDNAPNSLITEIANNDQNNQLLLRALIWRIKTTEEYVSHYSKGSLEKLDYYNKFINLIHKRIG